MRRYDIAQMHPYDVSQMTEADKTLAAICALLDGRQWSADTLDGIAAILSAAGFELGAYEGEG